MSTTDRIEINRRVIEEFRANNGKVQGWGSLILLTTRGAKTGQTRIYPLMSVPYGNDYLAVASKGGAPKTLCGTTTCLLTPMSRLKTETKHLTQQRDC